MKKLNTILENINALLKERAVVQNAFKQDNGEQCLPGQVWEMNTEAEELSFVMILEEIEKDKSFNVAPIFRWTEKAGPEDLFIPRNFFGTPMIISFELEFPISIESLKTCKGILESKELDYILSARKSLKNNEIDNETYTWGWQYLDKYDKRYQYHEALNGEIEELQGDLVIPMDSSIATLNNFNINSIKKDVCISFGEFQPVALAADAMYTGRKLLSTYWISSNPESQWLLTETETGKFLSFELESGDPKLFQNSLILDANGVELAKVDNGVAVIKLEELLKTNEDFFILKLADGTQVEFQKKD